MYKKIIMLIFAIGVQIFAQMPYQPGETVLTEHNLFWTDNYGYSTNIFDEIAINNNVVVIFWGSTG